MIAIVVELNTIINSPGSFDIWIFSDHRSSRRNLSKEGSSEPLVVPNSLTPLELFSRAKSLIVPFGPPHPCATGIKEDAWWNSVSSSQKA
ncbi:hypothetical protein TNIN_466101 [Trichonephila inaurata madagascariensis]|uniref:Uncharacterized protein n=1 Tax=Trichonephila inaurata madagascariensis TaxID=2747483 RepID=A0A8X6YEE9_9ARAC|nr:hypothetical protein TNIN_466101 [Trichonephila inaurata madagascariensis]